MQPSNLSDARAMQWDDEAKDWGMQRSAVELTTPRAWVRRQLVAAIWIVVAFAVGTLVFEMGAVS